MKKLFAAVLALMTVLSVSACGAVGEPSADASRDGESDAAGFGSASENPSGDGVSTEDSGTDDSARTFSADDIYVALGDSICRGYGLADPQAECYSSLIGSDYGCTVYNYGVDGQTSGELLDMLMSGEAEMIGSATVISISTGANNLLQPAYPLLGSLYQSFGKPDASIPDISGVVADMDNGLKELAEDIPEIISYIRSVNPDAVIIFQTVYNPYAEFDVFTFDSGGVSVPFSAFAGSCVSRINSLITDSAESCGYIVCDVYAGFSAAESDCVNADPVGGSIDPHPNAYGHRLIAALIEESLK